MTGTTAGLRQRQICKTAEEKELGLNGVRQKYIWSILSELESVAAGRATNHTFLPFPLLKREVATTWLMK
jgi:hypothetical protein